MMTQSPIFIGRSNRMDHTGDQVADDVLETETGTKGQSSGHNGDAAEASAHYGNTEDERKYKPEKADCRDKRTFDAVFHVYLAEAAV